MKLETAIVLAGGAGLRLRPLTDDRPKAMIAVAGRPLIDWVLAWLKKNSVRRVVIGVAYKGQSIIEHLENVRRAELEIQYSQHTVEGGTAEGFRLAIERYVKDSAFFAINGDELTDVRLQELANFHLQQKATGTITVAPLPSPFAVVEMDGTKIIAFREKPIINSVYVSVGVYAFGREILDYIPKTGDIERTAFPRLVEEQKLRAYKHRGFWVTVNTAKDLSAAEAALSMVES